MLEHYLPKKAGQAGSGIAKYILLPAFCIFLWFPFSLVLYSVCYEFHVRISWRKLLKGLFLTKNPGNNSMNGRICSGER
jgi:hypothetical protein